MSKPIRHFNHTDFDNSKKSEPVFIKTTNPHTHVEFELIPGAMYLIDIPLMNGSNNQVFILVRYKNHLVMLNPQGKQIYDAYVFIDDKGIEIHTSLDDILCPYYG